MVINLKHYTCISNVVYITVVDILMRAFKMVKVPWHSLVCHAAINVTHTTVSFLKIQLKLSQYILNNRLERSSTLQKFQYTFVEVEIYIF